MKNTTQKIELRIDWSEIDAFGHVNNLAILKYVQAARVNYLESIGLMQMQAESKIGPILASINCQYRKPLFYPGKVKVLSKVDLVKNTSFSIKHQVLNHENEVAAEAQDIIVMYDFNINTKFIIPDQLKQKINELENSNICT